MEVCIIRGQEKSFTSVAIILGGVQFCFADGSVRTLRRGTTTERFTPDWYVLQELAGWRDGGQSNKRYLFD